MLTSIAALEASPQSLPPAAPVVVVIVDTTACCVRHNPRSLEWMESRDAGHVDRLDSGTATVRPERNSIVPPYWQRRERSDSRLSCNSADARGSPIRLEDHTDEDSEQCKALWARSVTIDDYVVVGSGTTPALGAYVVWNITVDTLNVSSPQGSLHI